jgi:hypothetical protein
LRERGKKLVLLTNSHPVILEIKHRPHRRVGFFGCRLHVARVRRTEGKSEFLAGGTGAGGFRSGA